MASVASDGVQAEEHGAVTRDARGRTAAPHVDSAVGAFARTMVSSFAFLFQRPIRLFRPVHCRSAS